MSHIYNPSEILLPKSTENTIKPSSLTNRININSPTNDNYNNNNNNLEFKLDDETSEPFSIKIRRYYPLLLSGLYFFLSVYFNNIMQVYGQRAMDNSWITEEPNSLPDIGHKLLPHWSYTKICDWWVISAYIITFIRFCGHNLRLVILRRYFQIHGTMFILRGISIFVTQLTIPEVDCKSTIHDDSAFIEAFWIMTSFRQTCSDIMFSGHTTALTIIALTWTHYSKGEEWRLCYNQQDLLPNSIFIPRLDAVGDPQSCSLTAVLVWLYAVAGYILIIDTRFHYTLDVFIAFILTQLLYRLYGYYVKTVLERNDYFSKLIVYLEQLTPITALNNNNIDNTSTDNKPIVDSDYKPTTGIAIALGEGEKSGHRVYSDEKALTQTKTENILHSNNPNSSYGNFEENISGTQYYTLHHETNNGNNTTERVHDLLPTPSRLQSAQEPL